jgi:hypothetical protein
VSDYGPSKNLAGRRVRNERNEKELLEFLRKKKKEED